MKIKNVICFLLASFVWFSANATDTLSFSKCDSLSTVIEKLEHDINYLKCDHAIKQFIFKATDSSNVLDNKALNLYVLVLDKKHKFNRDLIKLHEGYYVSCLEYYNSLVRERDVMKRYVNSMLLSCDFSNEEVNLLNTMLESCDKCVDLLKSSIDYYDTMIYVYNTEK